MKEFDLLSIIGQIDDRYIMDARKRPRKRSVFPAAVAAVLTLVVLGTGGIYLLHQFDDTRLSEAIAATADTPEEADAEAAPVPEVADSATPAYSTPIEIPSVVLLAGAVYPESIPWDDFEAKSANWTENQVTPETASAFTAFSFHTAPAILQNQSESGCYSPLSLYQTLSILASGAQGETKESLLSILGMQDLETLKDESGKLYRVNYKNSEAEQLQISNSLWLSNTTLQSESEINRDWVQNTAEGFYADLYEADFSLPESSEALGLWISDHTGSTGHAPLHVEPDTAIAVMNAVRYGSHWISPFDTARTVSDSFYTDSEESISCEFMQQEDPLGSFAKGDGYTKSFFTLSSGIIEFVLPDEGVAIDTLLSEDRLWNIFGTDDYSSAHINWRVPKFTTTAEYDLKDTLSGLGLSSAFDPEQANFSTISNAPLYIDRLHQGTAISVDEEGIVASSYTIATMYESAAPNENPPIIDMNLNRPFLYRITADDGSTLFLGVVRSPNQ